MNNFFACLGLQLPPPRHCTEVARFFVHGALAVTRSRADALPAGKLQPSCCCSGRARDAANFRGLVLGCIETEFCK